MLKYAIMLILVGVLESIVRRRYETRIHLVEFFGRVLGVGHAGGSATKDGAVKSSAATQGAAIMVNTILILLGRHYQARAICLRLRR